MRKMVRIFKLAIVAWLLVLSSCELREEWTDNDVITDTVRTFINNDLPYWLDAGPGQFMFIHYGGDYNNPAESSANMAGGTYNDDLRCYVLITAFIRKVGV